MTRGEVTQRSARPAREERRPQDAVGSQRADAVDTPVNGRQPALRAQAVDAVVVDPERDKLPARHSSALAPAERRKPLPCETSGTFLAVCAYNVPHVRSLAVVL